MTVTVISIGAIDAHPLRGERQAVRTGHATTTLISQDAKRILVDPGLPSPALVARLEERTGLRPGDITHVFLTSFRPDVRRALGAFEDATWWISEAEREGVGVPLLQQVQRAEDAGDRELHGALLRDAEILKRFRPAPDELATGVKLFPLPGTTPGMCGVIVAGARHTLVVCGDAIQTIENLERGQVPQWSADVTQAQESLKDAIEIADLLILGRDNLVVNPTRRLF